MLPSPRTDPTRDHPGPPRTLSPPSLPPCPPSLGTAGTAPPPATAKLDLANLGFDQTPKFVWFHSSAAFPHPWTTLPPFFFSTNNRTLSTRKERRTQTTQSNHKTHTTTEFQACNLTCQWSPRTSMDSGIGRQPTMRYLFQQTCSELSRSGASEHRGSPTSSSLFCPETCLHPVPPPFLNLQVGLVSLTRFSGRPGIEINRIGLSGIWSE